MEWKKGLIESLELLTFFQVPAEPEAGHFWYDADGKETAEPLKVVRKEAVTMPRWRMAVTPEDFHQVYEREFVKTTLEPSDANYALFTKEVKKHIHSLIEKHLAHRTYSNTDFKAISVAESFLNARDPYMIGNPKPMTELAEEMNHKIIDKLPYDIHQYRFFSFDGAILIQYHFNPGDDFEEYKRFVFSHENLQLIIRFEREFSKANESEVIALLEKQYSRCEIMGTPPDIWLDSVTAIIDHKRLLKRQEYSKNDAVKLWFKQKRAELTVNTKLNALTLGQIALIRFYNNDPVTRQNHNAIARQYGHTSGEKLFQKYTYYSSNANRKGAEDSLAKLKNKIELFESVLDYVAAPHLSKIQEEIVALKALNRV